MAEKFGDISAVTLLSQILREGKDADEELTDLADYGTSVRLPKLGLRP
jgi:ferritin-like metal-binding protein YciE